MIDIPFQAIKTVFIDADLLRIEHRVTWTGSILQTLDNLDRLSRDTRKLRARIDDARICREHERLGNVAEIVDALYQLEQILSDCRPGDDIESILVRARSLSSCQACTRDTLDTYGASLETIFQGTTVQIQSASRRSWLIATIKQVIGDIVRDHDRKWSGRYQIAINHGVAPKCIGYQQYDMVAPIPMEELSDLDDAGIIARFTKLAVAESPRFRLISGAQDSWFQVVSDPDAVDDIFASLIESDLVIRVLGLPADAVCTY